MRLRIKWVALLCSLIGLGVSSQADIKSKMVTSKDLGGDERYLVYVSTDKPIYRAGERVFVRAVVLNAADNTPYGNQFSAQMQIRGPKGEVLFNGYASGEDSSAGFQWEVPEGSAGGEYTVEINSRQLGLPPAKRTFDVRAYRPPRLKSQIEFTREGYGPGDKVQASVSVTRAEGGIPAGAAVTVVARVDGEEIFNKSGLTVDENGHCFTEFTLPKEIAVGDGTLAFILEDGGVVETASKTLPILLQNLEIHFYPEGGDLIAGVPNRVYVQAYRPDGKPADIQGFVSSVQRGKTEQYINAQVVTEHEGRGRFSFTPSKNTQYALTLTAPSGISRTFPLPDVKPSGAVLSSGHSVFNFQDKIDLHITSVGIDEDLSVTLHKREKQLDKQSLDAVKNKQTVSLDAQDAEGVLIATLWAGGRPLAERLIYRKPKFGLNVHITADKDAYVPGENVVLDIQTTDEHGRPVEAVVGLSITDDAVLEMIETRDKAPRLPVMVFLEHEVDDLADAQVYLDTQNPDAALSLDLLLGTQGWRRFALVNFDQLLTQYPEAAKRIMAVVQPAPVAKPRAVMRMQAAGVQEFAEEEVMVMGVRAKLEKARVPEIAGELDALEEVPPVLEENMGGNKKLAAKEKAAPLFAMADRANVAEPKRQAMVMVREYAHQVQQNRKPNDRIDFTETLYWHKGIRTGARDGKAQVTFGLSDSVTSFRVMADAFGRNGALSSQDATIESVEPFYIEPKMPLTATVGDQIDIPVAMVNASTMDIEKVSLLVRGEGLSFSSLNSTALNAGQRVRQLVRLNVTQPGSYQIQFSAIAGEYSDAVTRTLEVSAKGFPVAIARGGLLSNTAKVVEDVVIPSEIEASSLVAVAKIHPSPLASMEEALNALLREPYGCFEQTSSTTYPLVMAQQYFLTHQGVDPEKISQAKSLLDKGYQRLTSFESKDKGYEWFGGNPAHEALTAYGLMEFVDMAKVMPVDEQMISRTRNWLLGRRDGKGGFKRNERALDSFGRAPEFTTNAYIVWSLLESGEPASNLVQEIASIKKHAQSTKDTYIIALAANIMFLTGDKSTATELASRLQKSVDKNGAVSGASTSITRSGGDALTIETTSLAILAWLKDDAHWAAQVEKSMQWLFERSKAGRFGSTQSTVLALKAINAYDAARAKPKQPGAVQLYVDGKRLGKPVKFDSKVKGAIELPDFAAALTPGKHRIEMRMTDGSEMPFALEIRFHTNLPASEALSEIKIATQLVNSRIKEGGTTELNVAVSSGQNDAPTPMAIIGIPGGLEVRHDQLKELVGADRISAYEVLDRELVLYWRALPAGTSRTIPITLTAAIPGTYTAPASRGYLYYTDEYKDWQAGSKVVILPR